MDRTFLERLDAANNETEVRERLAGGKYNQQHASLAREWLRRKEEERAAAIAARSEARDDESLSLSRKAIEISERSVRNSERSTRIAIAALVLSIAIALQKLIEWYTAK
jgi:hypothetical protein